MTLSFDPCLLIMSIGKDVFGIIGMQTDNTLILALASFSQLEDLELNKAKLCAKPKEKLMLESPLIFNGGILTRENEGIQLCQKNQADKLQPIDFRNDDYRQSYIEQRAYGVYIAIVYQPEASFDLLVAAQH